MTARRPKTVCGGARRGEARPRRRLGALGALLVALLGCACDDAAQCVDRDLDGYGPGCERGEDCDPDNVLRNIDCVTVPPPDCAADPISPGCPCLAGGMTTCLDDRAGVGVCTGGTTRCVNDFWGTCDGGSGPRSEVCNGSDDDCDGLTDEAVMSPCGGCTPGCVGGVWGEPPEAFEPTEGFELTRLNELTLARVAITSGAVWVANSAESTLSRIDAALAVETARYPTGGAEPSRVAVDFLGDAWVVNREFEGVSSVTKIAGEADRCVDRDLDGLRTSTGPTDVLGIDEDECVRFSVPVGPALGVARSIAIDGDTGLDGVSGGDAWVGLHDAEAVVELDGLTGAELRRIETPGFAPYGSTFDRWGTLWIISREGLLARIDPRPEVPTVEILEVPLSCYLLYGLAADLDGRLLMTGFSCDRVVSYDPALDRWRTRASPPSPRAAAYDASEDRFFIAHTGAELSEVDIDPLRIERTLALTTPEAQPLESVGVAVDALGQVWTISSGGGTDGAGLATRLDPSRGEVTAQVSVGAAPHVQGDLSGSRVRFGLVEEASTTHVFEGCGVDAETEWGRVSVAGVPGAYGTIEVEARHAATRGGLAGAAWQTLGVIPESPAPWDLAVPNGGAVELRLTLRVSGRMGAPRVQRVGLEWQCPGPD